MASAPAAFRQMCTGKKHRRRGVAVAASASSLAFLFLLPVFVSANSVVSWGRQVLPLPSEMAPLVDVAAGDSFNLGLKPGGEVVAWGANNYRESEVPEDLPPARRIAAGSAHALVLLRDGTVIAWGDNRQGQATPPPGLGNIVAIDAGREHSIALDENGAVRVWGANSEGQAELPQELGRVRAISAGLFHNLALLEDGTVVAWGLNSDGQASVPEDLDEVVAVAAGGFHSLALRRDGSLVAWGNDDFGQASLPENISSDILRIRAGIDHSLILLEDGKTVVWGRNHYGQTTAPSDLAPGRRIAAGDHHNVVVTEDGNLVSWGKNNAGQSLNFDDLAAVVSISAWDSHTVALKKDGTVFWWGADLAAGIQPDKEMLQDVVAVAAGRAHGLALRADGAVIGWGDNFYGQASPPEDLQNAVAIAAGEFHSLALRNDGTVVAWGNNYQGQTGVPSRLNQVVAIAAGREHSVALNQGGLIFAWGNNFYGQRRVPSSLNSAVAVASGAFHNIALRSNGTMVAWGSNLFDQTSIPPGLSDAVTMAASRSHSVAIRENRKVVAWGSNHYGQSTLPDNLERVVDVAAGGSRTVAVVGDLQPPRFVSQMESSTVRAGENVFLMPLTEGSEPLLYQWLKDGDRIPEAQSPALSLSDVTALDSGSYSLIMANPAGNVTSRSFSIEVEDPSVTVEATPRVAVLGDNAAFRARAHGTEPIRYQWHKDGEPLSGATKETFLLENVREDDTGIYTVEVANEFRSVMSDPVEFLVAPQIQKHPPRTAAARIGERVRLEIEATGSPPLEIQWLRDGAPIPGATGPTLVLENIGVEDGGVYRAVVSNPAGNVTTSETALEINPHIIFQPESQVFSAFEGTAVFEVRATGTPPLSYQWMKDGQLFAETAEPRLVLEQIRPADAGDYHVVVANAAGKVESDKARLVIPPAIVSHPQSETVRAGEEVKFAVQVRGTKPFRFQWLKNGEPIPGEEGATLRLTDIGGGDSSRYSVIVSNEVGTVTSQEGALAVSPEIVRPPEAVEAETGDDVFLAVEAEGSRPLFYQWSKNGTTLPNANEPVLTLENVEADDSGEYSVIVSNKAGITVSDNISVEVR